MSENIQSIANGTYTIGSTNELTFSAGPGIKIDSPSAGTVRIGTDETVLWSGTATSGDRVLSESWKNFDKISITHACTYGGARPCAPDTIVDTIGLTNKSACTFFCSDQVTTQLISAATGAKEFYETQVTFSAIDDTTLRFYPAFVKFINYPTGTSNLQGRYNRENSREYYKIVGINRISNA